eukprot:TRINITY_DN20317_c0_g1_i2.p2 TRINITY_DN20317_c0_g1~~TRINITY_DN20317_c0_g1_i2.p2  ORF type:complete len:145 (-),score=17.61 TRINITY_DN20317_c0_g1_i2:24-458(-)
MIRRPPRSTQGVSSAASDVYKRQGSDRGSPLEEFRSDLNLASYDFRKAPLETGHQTSYSFCCSRRRSRIPQESVIPNIIDQQREEKATRAFLNLKNFLEAHGGTGLPLPRQNTKRLPPLFDHAMGKKMPFKRLKKHISELKNRN